MFIFVQGTRIVFSNAQKNKLMKKRIIFIVCLFLSFYSFALDVEINSKKGQYILDDNVRLIVCNNSLLEYSDLEDVTSLIVTISGVNYEFSIFFFLFNQISSMIPSTSLSSPQEKKREKEASLVNLYPILQFSSCKHIVIFFEI